MSRKDNTFGSDEENEDSAENSENETKEEKKQDSDKKESSDSSDHSEDKKERGVERPLREKPMLKEDKKPGRSGRHVPHFILFAGVLLVGIIIGAIASPSFTGNISAAESGTDIGAVAAEAKIVDYIASRLELSYPGIEVVSEGVEESADVPGTYEVVIKMTYQDQPQSAPYYVTKDGKWMFGGLIDLNEELPEPAASGEPASTGVPKSDKPVVDLFIMSYCPYGLQMQKAMLPVMELFGDKADITVKWVDYIMHGKKEIDENNVQYCIQKEQPGKYIEFAQCFTQSGDSPACQEQIGIDEAKLQACITATDEEFKITELYDDQGTWSGGKYPQYPVYTAENSQFGVQGSPTLVINGQKVSVARAPEAVKQAICDAFNTPPAECDAELPTGQATAGFGGDFEAGAGTAAAAQCG